MGTTRNRKNTIATELPEIAMLTRFRNKRDRPSSEPFLAPNTVNGLTYAIGDVHGRQDLLARLIDRISEDAAAFDVNLAEHNSGDLVVEGLRFFSQINVKIAGIVLSQVNVNKMARYGYTGHGYYKESEKYYRN